MSASVASGPNAVFAAVAASAPFATSLLKDLKFSSVNPPDSKY
jgi:hypothetical protein